MFTSLGKQLSLLLALLAAIAIGNSGLAAADGLNAPGLNLHSYHLDSSLLNDRHQQCRVDTEDCHPDSHDSCSNGCLGLGVSHGAGSGSWYQGRTLANMRLLQKTHPAFAIPAYRPPIT